MGAWLRKILSLFLTAMIAGLTIAYVQSYFLSPPESDILFWSELAIMWIVCILLENPRKEVEA